MRPSKEDVFFAKSALSLMELEGFGRTVHETGSIFLISRYVKNTIIWGLKHN